MGGKGTENIKGSKRKAHYTVRIANRICEYIALGDTIKAALAKEPLGPSLTLFWRWLDEYPEFREKYERARQMQADVHADRILEMAAEVVANPRIAPAYRVASDILKWQAEIRDPKKYGQKVQHELKAPPLKPEDLKAEIKRLEDELGVTAQIENPAPPPNRVPDLKDVIDVDMPEILQ
jgi:hypothetical protein